MAMKITIINVFGPDIILKQEICLDAPCPALRDVLKALKDHHQGKWENFLNDDLSLREGCVILVNGRNVSSLEQLDTQIHEGDEITFTVLVAGG
jgi:molybdopterin converting factor small subunit